MQEVLRRKQEEENARIQKMQEEEAAPEEVSAMKKDDLDLAATLSVEAAASSDGKDNNEKWTQRMKEDMDVTVKKHKELVTQKTTREAKQLEVLRAKCELHEVAMERMEGRVAQLDEGLAGSFKQLRVANAQIVEQGLDFSTADGEDELPASPMSPQSQPGLELSSDLEEPHEVDEIELPGAQVPFSPCNIEALMTSTPGNGATAFAKARRKLSVGGNHGPCKEVEKTAEQIIRENYLRVHSDGDDKKRRDSFYEQWSHYSIPHLSPEWKGNRPAHERTSYTDIHGPNCARSRSQASSRPLQELTLRQLKELMNSVYSLKLKADEKCRQSGHPRKTMEHHLYEVLVDRYKTRTVVMEWTACVFRALEKYARRDVDVQIFGKILRNQLSEGFADVQGHLRSTANRHLRDLFHKRRPGLSREHVDAIWRDDAQDQGVPLGDAVLLARFLYRDDHSAVVINRLGCLAGHDDGSLVDADTCLRYRDIIQLITHFQLQLQEAFISDFISIFSSMDKYLTGVLAPGKIIELIHRLAAVSDPRACTAEGLSHLMEAERLTLFACRDMDAVTFSEAVDACTNLISARWSALGEASQGVSSDESHAVQRPARGSRLWK